MKELQLHIPGFTIAAKAWGNPQNPPILALHGWLDNANSFNLMAPYLENDFYFIAIDLPGHGHSSHLPQGCQYHFIDALFNILAIIKALNLPKVHLLGHSLGACLGSLLAGIAPTQCLSLYLIEGLGPISAPSQSACEQLAAYAQLLNNHAIKTTKGYESVESAAAVRAYKSHISLNSARILCERSLSKKQGTYYWHHDNRLLTASPLKMTEEQVLSCLSNIQVKTELLIADQGFPFDSTLMQQRRQTVPQLRVKNVIGGHHHLEQPERVGPLLAAFYQEKP